MTEADWRKTRLRPRRALRRSDCVMRISPALSTAIVALTVMSYAPPAAAGGDGEFIAGAAGFAFGTLFGSAMAQPRYYYAPAPVYVAPPPPVIYAPAPVYYYAPPPWTAEWYSYCASKHPGNFDACSGTFLDIDGYRRLCV